MPSSWLCARCGGLCHRRVLTMKWHKGRKLDLCINCAELVEAVVFNGKLKALKEGK